MSSRWRTHPTMAYPHGRLLELTGGHARIQERDGTWSTITGLTEPPAGAQPVTDDDAPEVEGEHDAST